MESDFIYQGHQLTNSDIVSIRTLISTNPDKSRWFISRELCRQWNWRQQNGALKDMLCRSLLLKLESVGLIILPPRKRIINNPLANRKPPELVEVDQTPIVCDIENIQPIELRSVRKTQYEKLYNSLIHEHHYLRYTHPIGENIKYIFFSNGRPIACMGWTSAVWHIGCRDRFIGWSAEIRKKNLHLIAYNTRFLILPWVKVPYLASHLLGLSALLRDFTAVNCVHPVLFPNRLCQQPLMTLQHPLLIPPIKAQKVLLTAHRLRPQKSQRNRLYILPWDVAQKPHQIALAQKPLLNTPETILK
ncbi:hypothetical protein ES705_49535 [subsurface metagenome]